MRLIRLKEVKHATGLGRSTIYKYIEDGFFPKSVSLGERAVAWVESEVEAWIEARISAREAHESLTAQPRRSDEQSMG